MRTVLALLVAVALTACGGGGEPEVLPSKVDPSLAPAEAAEGRLKLFENEDDGTRSAFADAGENSLIADGRLWEIRRAERLVGTLQISTVVPDVDLSESRERKIIVQGVLVGNPTRIRVDDIEVSTLSVGDKAVYVWFGADTFQVLTIKGFDEIEPEQVLASVIEYQSKVPAWEPLPVVVDENDSR